MPNDPNYFCMFKPTVSLTRLLSVFLVLGFVLFVPPTHVWAADAEPTVNLFTELNTYAQFSKAAYAGEAEMRQISADQGYTLSLFENIQGLELSYSLLTNDVSKTQIIAVRGTSNVENALVDIALRLVADKHAEIRLHQGFAQAAESLYLAIRPHLNKNYKITTTGHSLGGAVALILAMYLDKDHYLLDKVVTFGQPKVTNVTGALHYRHLNVLRVVTPRDLVPLVPPLDPVDINNLDVYWHIGTELILLAGKDYSLIDGLDCMLRATKILGKKLGEENVQNHQMVHYLRLIESKMSGSRHIPYKNDFNLFGLFETQ